MSNIIDFTKMPSSVDDINISESPKHRHDLIEYVLQNSLSANIVNPQKAKYDLEWNESFISARFSLLDKLFSIKENVKLLEAVMIDMDDYIDREGEKLPLGSAVAVCTSSVEFNYEGREIVLWLTQMTYTRFIRAVYVDGQLFDGSFKI